MKSKAKHIQPRIRTQIFQNQLNGTLSHDPLIKTPQEIHQMVGWIVTNYARKADGENEFPSFLL